MGEAAVAANGGAGGKVLGEFFSFAGDVDDAFAVGVFGAAEEGAEAELGGALGEGAGLRAFGLPLNNPNLPLDKQCQ